MLRRMLLAVWRLMPPTPRCSSAVEGGQSAAPTVAPALRARTLHFGKAPRSISCTTHPHHPPAHFHHFLLPCPTPCLHIALIALPSAAALLAPVVSRRRALAALAQCKAPSACNCARFAPATTIIAAAAIYLPELLFGELLPGSTSSIYRTWRITIYTTMVVARPTPFHRSADPHYYLPLR